MKNPTELLKDFFDKSLLINLSTKTIDQKWGEHLKKHISNHAFTDPFTVDEQTDSEQVQYFNKLMKTEGNTIKWRRLIPSGSQLYIKPENKQELITDAVSQLYLQLSVLLFENLIGLLKKLISDSESWDSFKVINDFSLEFKSELKDLDEQNVSYKYPTPLLLHNLRIFRNCITHADSKVSYLESKFNKYNEDVEVKKKRDEVWKDFGHLSKIRFCYKFSKDNTRLSLDKKAFESLSDLYSQIAYVAYRCYCKKQGHKIEI